MNKQGLQHERQQTGISLRDTFPLSNFTADGARPDKNHDHQLTRDEGKMNQTPTVSESGFFNGGVDALSQATSSLGINAKLSDDESKTSKKRFKAYRERLRQLNDQTISEGQLVNSAKNSFNPSPGFISKTALAQNDPKETFHEIGTSSEAEQTHFRADNHFNHGMISSDTNEWS